jgi:hypothetical protein
MPVAKDTTYERPFDATGERPLEAMEQVLAEVQRWQQATADGKPER